MVEHRGTEIPLSDPTASDEDQLPLLIVIAGSTASGKSSLALKLAELLEGEVISCDSVALYRGLDIGSAKPGAAERARICHHGLDILDPDEPATAGDYARYARQVIQDIQARDRLPILVGGTGLYLRATLDGLAPAPVRDDALRDRLRGHAARRGPGSLHRVLRRLDPVAAGSIHPNDTPKLVRSLEVTLLGRLPQTEQWSSGRQPLTGFRILQIGLQPPRTKLYERINQRAAKMFTSGLLEETSAAAEQFGDDAAALRALGYAQALDVLRGRLTLEAAVSATQQGHRNYAKRQGTWFRRDKRMHWFSGFGDEEELQTAVLRLVAEHLITAPGQDQVRVAENG